MLFKTQAGESYKVSAQRFDGTVNMQPHLRYRLNSKQVDYGIRFLYIQATGCPSLSDGHRETASTRVISREER